MGEPVRVALVTGGGTGIGRAIAQVLLRDGWRVAVAGRREASLKETGAHAYPCDVTDRGAVAELIQRLSRDHGRLDGLVNCAGIARAAALHAMTDGDIDDLIAVNLRSVLTVTRAALPMLEAAEGSIINIGSSLSHRPQPGSAVYAATKGAIDALTRALALELGPKRVRVNAIIPALVRSDIYLAAGMPAEKYEALLALRGREYPLGRVGEPEEVAELASFLLSKRAAWITGACMPIDGGASVNSLPGNSLPAQSN